jgi:serine protease Do
VLAVVLAGLAAGGVIVAQPVAERANPSPSPFAAAYEAVAPAVVRVVGTEEYSTGLIVSPDGLILTHGDVAGRNELSVYFADGREAKAKVLLRDAATKAAVLQLLPAGMAPGGSSNSAASSAQAATSAQPAARPSWAAAKLGSSQNLSAGSWVATVAYPRGADAKDESEPSLSVGLLVARGPLKTTLAYGGDWLVTDAMMNEASEGGALVDARGQVVGLLSKPQRNAETNTALNLALPVELAVDLLRRARETPDPPIKEEPGKNLAEIGYLGVKNSAEATACRIVNVIAGSPAEKAGLKMGDVIVRFGKTAISNYLDLRLALRQTSPGDKIRVAVRRQGEEKEREIEVTLGKIPARRN